jgi:hypothetical protein
MNTYIPVFTTLLTIMGGAFTFLLGQVFIKVLLEPASELKREIGRIAYSLDFYANRRYAGTADEIQETREVFRQHACRLRELASTVMFYGLWRRILSLPKIDAICLASGELIGHSNFPSSTDGSHADRAQDIRKYLRIR